MSSLRRSHTKGVAEYTRTRTPPTLFSGVCSESATVVRFPARDHRPRAVWLTSPPDPADCRPDVGRSRGPSRSLSFVFPAVCVELSIAPSGAPTCTLVPVLGTCTYVASVPFQRSSARAIGPVSAVITRGHRSRFSVENSPVHRRSVELVGIRGALGRSSSTPRWFPRPGITL